MTSEAIDPVYEAFCKERVTTFEQQQDDGSTLAYYLLEQQLS